MLKPSAPRANSYLKFRDSLTLMDSRFRGNDGREAPLGARASRPQRAGGPHPRNVDIPPTPVIPAKAGIHRLIQGVMNPET